MILGDSHFLLHDATDLLKIIERYYDQSINDSEISIVLRLKIKHFLEDIKSALDYAAFHVFSTYCAKNVAPADLKNIEKHIYFPVRDRKDKFDSYIKGYFKGLLNERKDIVNLFESCQPFPNQSQWLHYLSDFVNKNKHRNLSHQRRSISGHIEHLELPGITIRNLTVKNVGGILKIGDTVVNDGNHPAITKAKGTITVDYYFTDFDQPVLPTLQEILSEASKVISDLEKIL